jgi:hypothetical protein
LTNKINGWNNLKNKMQINQQPKFYYPQLIIPSYIILKINKKEIKVTKITIIEEEYDICEKCELWCSNKKGNWGSGLINSKDDKHKAERTGLLGEMAFSKISSLPVNIEYCEGGKDNDFCITSGKSKIDVKTAAQKPKYNAGLVRCASESKKEISLRSDLYVFGYIEKELKQEKIAVVVLVGGEYSENIIKMPVRKAKMGYHYNYEIKYNQLIPIENLLLLIK